MSVAGSGFVLLGSLRKPTMFLSCHSLFIVNVPVLTNPCVEQVFGFWGLKTSGSSFSLSIHSLCDSLTLLTHIMEGVAAVKYQPLSHSGF